MKTPRLLLFGGLAIGAAGLLWQAWTIHQLRVESSNLKKDLRLALDTALDDPTLLTTPAGQTRHDQLELIKLRNQVRDLNESLVESHAKERAASVKSLVHLIIPASLTNGPWTFRPEWKGNETQATNQYLQAIQELTKATNDFQRFLCLDRAAKMSLAVGRTEDARKFATDALVMDDKYSRGDPTMANGDITHDANLVLGRLALDDDRLNDAKRRLLAAGATKGSPVLNTFGPNMSLASDLLAKGEQETVLQYFELCRKFWTMGSEKLDEWSKDIHAGRTPDFGANLVF